MATEIIGKMKKRSKRSRLRGKRTAGWGSMKKRRGKGSKGGKGMAGTGKRAGQKKTWVLRYKSYYFGKRGFKSLKQIKGKEAKEISLEKISEQLDNFLKTGMTKKTEKGIEIELKGYKVLSQGKLEKPLIIKASSFSKKAEEKIKKAGGEAIVV